jgi:hypothetical protein
MAAATCPRCDEAVTVPAGVQPETRVACPLCQEELTGEDFIGQFPPALVLLDAPEEVVIEESSGPVIGDDFDPENPFGEVREAEGGAAVVTRVRRTGSGASRKKSGGARQIISIVLGGMLALPIAQLILWQLNRDPVHLADSFRNVRWMHWAMPKDKTQLWERIRKEIDDFTKRIKGDPTNAQAYRDRGKSYEKLGDKEKAEADFAKAKQLGLDTSTSGLQSNAEPQELGNSSGGSFNRPEPDMVFDMDDLERGQAGTNRPEEFPLGPAPEPELLEGQGWISDEPLFGATILRPMLSQTRMENKEWDAQPADLEEAERRRLDEGFYTTLAQLGLGITFSDETDPKARAIGDEIAELLATFGDNEKKLRLIAEHGQFKYSFPRDGLRGIALYGTITSIDKNEPYFETTLVVEGKEASTDVVVISRVNPEPPLKAGQQVLILGAVILNPSENINSYQGDAEQLVIGGYPVVIKQP